jgi:anti-sigma factor RsiW
MNEITMNTEALERILIDRATGELPPDTAALLDAYLQSTPPAAEAAAAIEETLFLAKQALRPSSEPALPPPTFARPLRILERESKPDWRLAQWAYGMAACFAGGLVLGWFLMRTPGMPPHRQAIVVNQPPAQTVAAASGFWSISRLYQAASAVAPVARKDQLIWESPVKKPQFNRNYDN